MTGASPSSRPLSFLDRFVPWKESSMMITPSEIAIGDVETLARIHRLDKVGPTGTIRAAHRRESNTTAQFPIRPATNFGGGPVGGLRIFGWHTMPDWRQHPHFRSPTAREHAWIGPCRALRQFTWPHRRTRSGT
jgi:hypothetical protein